jgi:hypothetical protein
MRVSACLVTRGDVSLEPVLEFIPKDWELVIWNNGNGTCSVNGSAIPTGRRNLLGYGRHAALKYASGEVIYTQDDDVIVSNPQKIVDAWDRTLFESQGIIEPPPHIVCNMPPEFRHHYTDSAMCGFGSVYHRNLPPAVFSRFLKATGMKEEDPLFLREADRALTVLSQPVLVDVKRLDRPFADAPNRLYRQPGHLAKRDQMLRLARKVRDA